MQHHVLHVRGDDRLPVLVDLTAAPGRTLVFTRTKRGAKTLTRQLVSAGVPAVELHGNLAQNARDRNLSAFSDGSARTMVATDIAARGIHVDDITLVIHADPPMEHKAYLHRSGRTARAGAEGTVVTLMTDAQVTDVRDLTRKAGIAPTTTKLRPGDPLLSTLAPGVRTFVAPRPEDLAPAESAGGGGRGSGHGTRRPAAAGETAGGGRSAGSRTGGTRSASGRGARTATRASVAAAAGSSAASGTGSARSSSDRSSGTGAGRSSGTGRAGGSGGTGRTGAPHAATGTGTPARGGAAAFSAGTRVGGRRGR